eukprot:SAG22_NODE_1337_length_4697_cov_2.318182_4_plen_41_part_00
MQTAALVVVGTARPVRLGAMGNTTTPSRKSVVIVRTHWRF